MKHANSHAIDDIWPAYQSNFARHVLGVARFLQSDTMATLRNEQCHTELKLSYEPYISLIGEHGVSLTEVADALGISKQAANQTANQIEKAGYIHRISSDTDRRSKLLQLTDRGLKLLADGAVAYELTESKILSAAPRCDIKELASTLDQLVSQLNLSPVDTRQVKFGAQLSRLSDHINVRLMTLTSEFGHPNLKLSFAHILSQVGPLGTRMQDVAKVRQVSKQAISAIASELEELGFIYRDAEAGNKRQQILRFTAQGVQLIGDSVTAVERLKKEFSEYLGTKKMQRLESEFHYIYQQLGLEHEEFGDLYQPELHKLASELRKRVGNDKAHDLARILLSQ
jgi:DNA-binding MarR family transcriptional regulator